MIASNESNRLLEQKCTSLQHSDTHHYVTLSFLCTSLLHGRHNKEANRDVGGADVTAAGLHVEAVPVGLQRTCASASVCARVCVCFSPFDVICVSCVVSLQLLIHIKQDNHRGDEVHRLPGGQQVEVGATVATTVAIAGMSPGSGNNTRASEDPSRGLGQRRNAIFLQKFSPRLLLSAFFLRFNLSFIWIFLFILPGPCYSKQHPTFFHQLTKDKTKTRPK